MNEAQYVVWQRMLNYDKEKFLEKGRTDTEKEVSMKIFDYLYKHGKEFNYYIVAKQNILDTYREYMIANQLPFNDKGIDIAVQEYNANYKENYLIRGELYRPIFYGEEEDCWGDYEDEENTCGDCGCHLGEQHLPNCDIERCPRCGGQMLSCDCGAIYPVSDEDRNLIPKLKKQQEIENKKLDKMLEELKTRHRKDQDAEM